jgi:streptogramin lyase/mono/diheme cytochrome c family protein
MGTWRIVRSMRRSSARWPLLPLIMVTASLALGYVVFGAAGDAAALQTAGRAATPSGLARVSGMVDSPTPFKAAQVRIRNVDKQVMYMVFTNAGQFRAMSLFPGNYEVSVEAKGLRSDVQKLVLKPGDNTRLKLSLRQSAGPSGTAVADGSLVGESAGQGSALTFESYDEIYPPGPGKAVAEQVCIVCHGENFLPGRPATEAAWNARIDHMVGTALRERDGRSYAEGLLAPRSSVLPFSQQDRADLLAYMVKNFGPGSKRRAVRSEREMPVDEAALGKAMYIEYYLRPDAPGQGSQAPEYVNIGYRGRRVGQDVRFDHDGNVWLTDRGYPHRLVKLDPRTGTQKDYLLPDPKNGIHEVLVDQDGMIWLPEHSGVQPSTPKRLLGFNPKTEQWERMIPMDPDNVVRNSIKWLQSLALDSKGNIYIGWIMGGAISKWERATNKVSVFRIPTPHAIPYGVVADRNDNIWMALWSGGKIAKFDSTTNQWTEFSPPTSPGHIRRLNVDSKNNIWTGIWSAGKRPGKLAKLDQTTGRWTEYTIPLSNSQPYDVAVDADENVWFVDSPTPDRTAALGKFNPRDGTFTFYPNPQFSADAPKIQITRDGAIWYSPRGSERAPAISVMYPDMDKITTLGAFYQNGPPGYPFRTARTTQTSR